MKLAARGQKLGACGLLAALLAACGDGRGGNPDGGIVAAVCSPATQTVTTPLAPPAGAPPAGITLNLQPVNTTLTAPLFVTAPPADPGNRLFVVEQGGTIRVLNQAGVLQGTFLDITGLVSSGGERGLLGLAFDPNYANNRRFYVSYTNVAGDTVVARYLVSGDPATSNVAVSTVDRILMTEPQPFANHNGGMIAFGPDGFLYIGRGDGGSGGDPDNHAQNLSDVLGKILRIDVSQATLAPQPAYAIPPDNPCLQQPGARGEIWSMGLRNPWRFSFDTNGDLYIGDVGQNAREEINVSTTADGGGRGNNYGWKIMEGKACFFPSSGCDMTNLTQPVLDLDHNADGVCSVIGGYVYRGTGILNLAGTYFYADLCAGFVRSFRLVNGQVTEHAEWPVLTAALAGSSITSFGEDSVGELYITTQQGGLFRITQ